MQDEGITESHTLQSPLNEPLREIPAPGPGLNQPSQPNDPGPDGTQYVNSGGDVVGVVKDGVLEPVSPVGETAQEPAPVLANGLGARQDGQEVVEPPVIEREPEPSFHFYKVGERVGLIGRILDAHDKGNLVIEIEGTNPGGQFDAGQYVHIAESVLNGGVDLILKTKRERLKREAAGG
jgi:hypothetical protein